MTWSKYHCRDCIRQYRLQQGQTINLRRSYDLSQLGDYPAKSRWEIPSFDNLPLEVDYLRHKESGRHLTLACESATPARESLAATVSNIKQTASEVKKITAWKACRPRLRAALVITWSSNQKMIEVMPIPFLRKLPWQGTTHTRRNFCPSRHSI